MTARSHPEPGEEADTVAGPASGTLRAAAWLTTAFGAALLAYALFLAIQWMFERPSDPLDAALLVMFSAGWGVAVLACARGLARRRRWAVAPVVTSTLLLVTVGWLLASGHGAEVAFGWAALGLAVACLVTVLAGSRDLR